MTFSLIAAALAGAAQPGAIPPISPPVLPLPVPDDEAEVPPTQADAETAPAAPEAAQVTLEGSDTPIQSVRFIGTAAPAPVALAARQFVGRPATQRTLQALVDALTAAYEETDIALYTIAIPQQDFSTGEVRVQLAEGFVEQLVFPDGASEQVQGRAAILTEEKPLSRPTLERAISLMRDIPGAKVKVGIKRGERAGGVKVSVTPTRKWSDIRFGINNSGVAGLDRGQAQARASLFSGLRDGDRTDALLLSAIDFDSYLYASISHQTPIGFDGLSLGISGSWLRTRTATTSGEAITASLSASYPVIRSYKRNLYTTLSADLVDSDSALLNSEVTSDRVRALRLGARYSQSAKRSSLAASTTLSRGFDVFGAQATPGISTPEFFRIAGLAGYDRQFGKAVVARLRVKAQYSEDPLPASERFSVGGFEYGRAFDYSVASGDRGVAGSLELALQPIRSGQFRGTEVYGFADYAAVGLVPRGTFTGRDISLASAGGGVRVRYSDKASLGLEAARAIERPFPDSRDEWRFNVSWTLKLNP